MPNFRTFKPKVFIVTSPLDSIVTIDIKMNEIKSRRPILLAAMKNVNTNDLKQIDERYKLKTKILDFENHRIQELVQMREWRSLPTFEKIGAAYDFVRDEIKFGYNISDDIPASQVLSDGYGQCNTKGNLLMALLRSLEIPCRFHGFTIDQKLQKGAIPSYVFWMAPKYIIHSWVEVFYDNKWINLEGFILDKLYLNSIKAKFPNESDSFCGYGVATKCFVLSKHPNRVVTGF